MFQETLLVVTPLAALGAPLAMAIPVFAFTSFVTFFSHTQLVGKLGWLDRVFVTPSVHRLGFKLVNNPSNSPAGFSKANLSDANSLSRRDVSVSRRRGGPGGFGHELRPVHMAVHDRGDDGIVSPGHKRRGSRPWTGPVAPRHTIEGHRRKVAPTRPQHRPTHPAPRPSKRCLPSIWRPSKRGSGPSSKTHTTSFRSPRLSKVTRIRRPGLTVSMASKRTLPKSCPSMIGS